MTSCRRNLLPAALSLCRMVLRGLWVRRPATALNRAEFGQLSHPLRKGCALGARRCSKRCEIGTSYR